MKILFVETGTTGFGGSFQSLLSTLYALKNSTVLPRVAFLNEPVYYNDLIDGGYSVYRLRDPLYSRESRLLQRRVLEKLRVLLRSRLVVADAYLEVLFHLPTISRLCRLVNQHGVDVVHMNTDVGRDFFGYWVGRFARVPVVFHLRSRDNTGLSASKLRLLHGSGRISFIAISEFVRRSNAEEGLDPNRVHVVHNAMIGEHSERSDPAHRSGDKASDRRSGHERVLFVGRLVPWKGADTLVRAFGRIIKAGIDARLCIVGTGPQEAELHSLVAQQCLGDRVSFLGYQPNPEALMESSDLVVVPSINEPFGRVVLEAFHSLTPVVASNSGGIPELIQDEINGLLFAAHDDEDLARQMYRVLTDADLAASLALAARQIVRQRFGQELYAERLEAIYTRAMDSAKRRLTE
jgi:glycosyltransferase involved in cell wall biosynthesis